MDLKYRAIRSLKDLHWTNFIALLIAGTINAFKSAHARILHAVIVPGGFQRADFSFRAEEAGLCVHGVFGLRGRDLFCGVGNLNGFFPA